TVCSQVIDLTKNYNEILIRLHPEKKRFFDAVYAGTPIRISSKDNNGNVIQLTINKDVLIWVNDSSSSVAKVDYSKLFNKQPQNIVREIAITGFDLNAAPLIRCLQDGTMRLVFCTLPPIKIGSDHTFNENDFGIKLQQAITAKILWDDRDLFYIPKPDDATISEILHFFKNSPVTLQNKAGNNRKWWKIW
ncbi:MAG: hypothetical protein ACM31E_03965, partial [Fibrobacterota bacterium]